MKWLKRLLILLASLLLSSVLIVAGVVLFIGESNYKRLLGWGAEQFLGSQLIIEGPFEVDISRNLSLTSGDIVLKANDDSYLLSVGKLDFSFRLGSYLQTGAFVINHLKLEDINLGVKETAEDDDFNFEDFKIPPVVIAQAHFNNLQFTYQELAPGTLHTFSLDELKIGELGKQQSVSLRASGQFEGQSFELEGMSNSVQQFIERQDPLTLQLKLSSAHINAQLQGKIDDPLKGRGMKLQIQTDIPQVRDLIEIVWDEIPILGRLQGSFIVRGDYTAPRLEEIDLHLQRGHEVDLMLSGSVADVLKGAGLDLQIDGNSNNPEVLSWLLFKKHDRMQTIQVSGRLQGDLEQFSLHDLDAVAQTSDGVKLEVNGNTVVHPEGTRLTQADANLTVQLSAPSTTAANLLDLEDIPELGPVSGSLGLALSRDALGIYSLDFVIGSPTQSQILLKGDVGYVQLAQELTLPELKLQTDIQVTKLAHLGKQLDVELPALGPARLRGVLVTQGSELLLQDSRLNIGAKGQLTLNATGLLATQLRDPNPDNLRVALDVDVQATELAQVGKQLDYNLPTLGPVQLRGKLVTQGSELVLQGANLNIGTQGQSTLQAIGMLATQLKDPENFRVAMNVDIQATELVQLTEPFGYNLPQLGQTHITGRLESKKSEMVFEDAKIVVGAAKQPTIRANGRVVTQFKKMTNSINVEYDVAVSPLVTAFSDLQPRNLGTLQGDAVISDLDGYWGIKSISVASAQTALYQLQLSGSFDDLENYDKAHIKSSLVIDHPTKLGDALGMDLSNIGSIRQQGLLTTKKGRLYLDGKASLGRTNSTSKINGYLKGGKPVIEGSINIPVLHLADFGLGTPRKGMPEPPKNKTATSQVFSREEINLEFLQEFNLNLAVSIGEVESEKLRIDEIDGQLKLENGHLNAPLRLVFEGGKSDIDLDIRAVAVPEYQLSITSDDISLGPLMAQIQDTVPIEGYTNVHLNLHTRGHSPHEMASSLSGHINLGLENARVPKKYIDLLSANLFGWVLTKTVAKDPYHTVNCMVFTFAVNAGEVKSETIIVDGPRLSLQGKIDINLGEETLDIVVIPKQKKHIFQSSSPVKVYGPMKDPTVKAVSAKAAVKEVGGFALYSSVYIPVRVVEKFWSLLSDGDKVGGGCEKIDKQIKAAKNKIPAQDRK